MLSQVKRLCQFGRAYVKQENVAELSLNKTLLQGCLLRSCKRHGYPGARRGPREVTTTNGMVRLPAQALGISKQGIVMLGHLCMPHNRPSEILLSPNYNAPA